MEMSQTLKHFSGEVFNLSALNVFRPTACMKFKFIIPVLIDAWQGHM